MKFSALIKESREKKYTHSKDFISKFSNIIKFSYNSYLLYERGALLPKINDAILIIDLLEINKRQGMYAWVISTMPTQEEKSFFMDIEEPSTVSQELDSNKASTVISKSHVETLLESPHYWEVIIFVNSHLHATEKKVIAELGLPPRQAKKILTDLYAIGILERNNKHDYISTKRIYLPKNKAFDELRINNFKNNTKQFLKQTTKKRVASTTVKLTTYQAEKIFDKVWESCFKLLEIESYNYENAKMIKKSKTKTYTFCSFFSERKFGG